MQQPQSQPDYGQPPTGFLNTPNYILEEDIKNIVGQIDPKHILDNLNHALNGEYYNKEGSCWEKVGDELVNDACRGWIITVFSTILNNASTMGIISEQQFSGLMDGTINLVTKEFRCNLEKFGFVEAGPGYDEGRYENKGTPDTSRMSTVSEMIFSKTFLVYSRSVQGSENKRIFKSLTFSDTGGYSNTYEKQEKGKSWIGRVLGR